MDERLFKLDLQNDRADRPKYERLKEHVVKEVLAGRLRPGQALPPERQWVKELGIAKMTVRHAMAALEQEGLIRRVPGRGHFVEADVQRKLKRGRDVFALVVPATRGGFLPSLLCGFEAAASTVHHRTIICSSSDSVDKQGSIVLDLLDQEVGGVAIMPPTEPSTPVSHVRQLQKHGIPVVFCHRRVEGVAAPLLATPYADVGRLAGETILKHGHRRVAYLASKRYWVSEAYEKGLQEALRAAGCESIPQMMVTGDTIEPHEESILAALEQVFSCPNPPTAIFASYDTLAEVVYLLLPRLGLRVPEDVSLIGFGSAQRDGAIVRKLTSVVIDETMTGRQAVSWLHEMRSGHRPIDDTVEVVIPLGLSDGETLAAAR